MTNVYDDYVNAQSVVGGQPAVTEIEQFLCLFGDSRVSGDSWGSSEFDLTDRIFATVSDYYCTETDCHRTYDAFKQMTVAMGVTSLYRNSLLSSQL